MKQLALVLLAAAHLVASYAQQPGQPFPGQAAVPYVDDLPKFDLDFQGGDVSELVESVQKELKKVDADAFLNVVIPTEHRHYPMPPLKMRNVNVNQLFRALEMASQAQANMDTRGLPAGAFRGQSFTAARYGFQTSGPATRESIWYFYVVKTQEDRPSKALRYFQLAPYLSQYTMDDIGRAIEAGWNMLEENEQTKLNFHKETKLLIAVGPPHQLETISMVLKELGAGMTNAPSAESASKRTQTMPKAEPAPKL